MPDPDDNRMDAGFEWRLKAALDRLTPPASAPRYASARGFGPWRIAPALLAAATSILLALAATATTGSPNPAVWTGDAAAAIGSVAHTSEQNQAPSPSQAPPAAPPRLAPIAAPTHETDHEASPKPPTSEHSEESPRPQPSPSPSPSEEHSGLSSPSPSPSPSPGSGEH